MAQKRKEELVNVEEALRVLSTGILLECSLYELYSLRASLGVASGFVDAVIMIREDQGTHFPPESKKS